MLANYLNLYYKCRHLYRISIINYAWKMATSKEMKISFKIIQEWNRMQIMFQAMIFIAWNIWKLDGFVTV